MRKLIKKILRESDEWDWVRDLEPSYLEMLKVATEHDDRINVYLHGDGTLKSINDDAGYSYMSDWDFRHLPDGYDDKTLLDSMLRKVEGEILDLERMYDEDSLASHKDYQDFLHLRNTIERLFPKKTLQESDDFDWVRDVNTPSDVAKFIANDTKIVSAKEIYLPYPVDQNYPDYFKPVTHMELGHSYSSFTSYCIKEYGLSNRDYYIGLSDKADTREAWYEYRKIIRDKLFFLKRGQFFFSLYERN